MAGKVSLEITKGALAGKTFAYDEKTRIFIGRQEDCGVVLPEDTVSRYHCVLEITPPEVKLQDFGSRNGTFLNGEKIGQRGVDQQWEQAKDEHHEEFILHDGDVVGLSSKCEFICHIEEAERCAICGATLPKGIGGNETVPEGEKREPMHYDKDGQRICAACHGKAEAEKQRIEAEGLAADIAAQLAAAPAPVEPVEPEQRKCEGCGKPFTPMAADNDLCESCLGDRAKVVDAIIGKLLGVAEKPEEKPIGPSPVQGYDKVARLGEGGMGEVWKVKERKTGKLYALKTMLPQVKADELAKRLFLREASVGQFLQHRNVVKTYQSGCTNDVFYILMDLCEGGSVDGLMEKHGGTLPLPLATYIILQVLDGLDYVHNMDIDVEIKKKRFGGTKEVHAKGVVHRDFKPGNIFLSDKSDHPVAMVADFGMAKAFDTAGLSRVTKTGTVMGTPVFMPRQQAVDFKYAKPEVDVWAAAASYYNMLTGTFPKNFRRDKNVWQIIVTEPAVPIRERNGSIPEKLAAVIDRALVEKPAIGYKSAAALRRDIVAALPDDIKAAVKDVLK